jgi:RNA polymerase I-specific transcription initiation factor RRN6
VQRDDHQSQMADHPVTDLSYGHLGKASYDTEENEWKFSVDLNNSEHRYSFKLDSVNSATGSSIQQLVPFKEWLAPSIRQIPQGEQRPSDVLKLQLKWLAKMYPETFPADTLVAELSKVDLSQKDVPMHIGSLLTVARAVDTDRVSGSRTTQILAVPCGDAGHILRLIRPRVEVRGWEKHSAARLTVLDSDTPEYGHWIGEGGIIRQILASDTENGSGTWLAVRQDTATTIFRPQYGRLHDASTISNGYPELFRISQLNPNPVASLTADQTQSRAHADVAFNPWYARQFAVVDTSGIWSIWDLEVAHGKKASQILSPSKRGSIYHDYIPDPLQKSEDFGHFDGWYRILWVCNISTMILCNRRHLAMVNLSGGTSRLQTVDIVRVKSQDWILDIKRSVTNNSHLFVLTTSRIFWVKVVPDKGGTEIRSSAVRIILSYRHFRNVDDETMRLVVLRDTSVSVLITSSLSPLVQFYCFIESTNPDEVQVSYQGSFHLRREEGHISDENGLLNVCFLPCPLVLSTSMRSAGAGLQYIEKDVRFFQVWALDVSLGLRSSTFAVHDQSTKTKDEVLSITAPALRVRQSGRRFGSKVIAESFIVPEGEQDEDDIDHIEEVNMQHNMQNTLVDYWQDDLRYRIDWRRIYRHVFGLDLKDKRSASEDVPSIRELLARTSDHIHQGLENTELATSTM